MDKDLENKIQNFERDMTKLEEFCKAHETLYIYGAGKYGARYYSLIKDRYKVSGFVVSAEKDCGSYQGLPVIPAANLPGSSSNHVGIIPAFKGSSADDIKQKFPAGIVDVFDIESHDFMSYSSMIKPLYDIHEKLKEYGPPAKLPLPPRDSKVNILIIRLDSIGDVICTTPLIREIRRNYPNASIDVVICRKNEDLLKNCPYIDGLLLYDLDLYESDFGESYDFNDIKAKVDVFVQENLKKKYDIAIEAKEFLVGTFVQQAILSRACGAKWIVGRTGVNLNQIISYNIFGDIYSYIFLQNFAMHETIYQLEMLRECGLEVESFQQELWPSEENRDKAVAIIHSRVSSTTKLLVAVAISGSTRRKSWPTSKYLELFKDVYTQYGDEILFILLGGKKELEKGLDLEQECKNVLNCAGKCSLNDTVALLEKCNLFLGSNTGALHMAAVAKVNAVVLYSDCLSDSAYINAGSACRWEGLGIINYNLIPPGGLDGCHFVCINEEPHCINQIKVEQVAMALRCMLHS